MIKVARIVPSDQGGLDVSVDDLKFRDPADQLVEGPYCQTGVVQVRIKLRARQSSLDGMGEVRFRPD
ncbi:hypothetical protein BY996DRAFT_6469009 [Phakopsora pachyrhizi]|uniref:Uncharacterized protein n=1 Tax=Phakopsora pachyrhizi TaxID=170000 RepID=A0AAV0BDL7_PHAPC|nr:hypothetical protein BY996DRAFT_6469009 [Phakopsora pachyrhizi]CAH7684189.1 hypothetical protein PPACK8108_LOCUS18239 [Phakopsora pachyrhizi]